MGSVLTALSQKRPPKLPVWFMRQAGRSLPEYRTVRGDIAMLDSCLMPELAAEITLQPVRRHDVDAAIFYSDIMVPLKLAGIAVDIAPGIGPVFEKPIRSLADVKALPQPNFINPEPIMTAIKMIRAELPETKDLLGFAGAPFTLAAYLVEGKPAKDHLAARALMHADPDAWRALLDWCAQISQEFLQIQIASGVQAVQLFDSWAGCLSRADYAHHVAPFSRKTLSGISVPVIHFATNSAHLLDIMAKLGVAALGVDHRISLSQAATLAPGLSLQGNLDPAYLFAGKEKLFSQALAIANAGMAAPAHIMNLGHGVPPNVDPGILTELVAFIHEIDTQKLAVPAPPHPNGCNSKCS